MIGVLADPGDHDVACEFFELFKTPWEFYRRDGLYDVVLCVGQERADRTAKLVIHYAGRKTPTDDDFEVCRQSSESSFVSYRGSRIPIYGESLTFKGTGISVLTSEACSEPVGILQSAGDRTVARIGYDLFSEIQKLLLIGQPPGNASIPTVELHIAVLRDLITGSGISLIEIPPVPAGFPFIACLTHDVDHPSIRHHRFDRTMLGFLYRALLGSMTDLVRGRIPIRTLMANWWAALKLPFVYAGRANDFWANFDDRYRDIEYPLRSTFFVIPFKGVAGRHAKKAVPPFRAARYGAADIAEKLQKLATAGCEIALHGIDAWLDNGAGRSELNEIRHAAGASVMGVRMHWLYFDQNSPVALENAGADYDSTVGYNEAVGYRAGTTQVFKPLIAKRLLELPLHVMDTALFYPSHLGLTQQQGMELLRNILDNTSRWGGCLTINWHDRSLAPERQWDECYRHLLQELRNRGACIIIAAQAVAWFRQRRSIVFESEGTSVRARVSSGHEKHLPAFRLRIHKAQPSYASAPQYVDVDFGNPNENISASYPAADYVKSSHAAPYA